MALTEYVFIARAMFVINDGDGACSSYYTYNTRFDLIGGTFLSRLQSKIFNALKYFGLFKSASRLGTDPFLTTLASQQCGRWTRRRPM